MTNQAILDEIQCAWTVIKTEHPEYPNLANRLEQALAQLRLMLQEPTDEEKAKMLEWLDEWRNYYRADTIEKIDASERQAHRAIRALIMAPKMSGDDVDRLVEVAREATASIHAKTADDQTEYKIAGAEAKLRAALVPFTKTEAKE